MLILLLFNVYYAGKAVGNRYKGWRNTYHKEKIDLYSITPYLRKIGIKKSDTVIFIPDGSNISLYLMNQKGWTQYTDARFNRGKPIRYNIDSLGIRSSIDKGAKYLIINKLEDIYLYPYVQGFCHNLVGRYGSVLIFNVKDSTINFKFDRRILSDSIFCGAEKTMNNKYLTNNDSIELENADTKSKDEVFAGEYSAKLNNEKPYGMTFKSTDVLYGESFVVKVWVKGAKDAKIVASGPVETGFYYTDQKIIRQDTITGWRQLKMEFFVPASIEHKELRIYLYNPDSNPAYFDNLQILKYRSIIADTTSFEKS